MSDLIKEEIIKPKQLQEILSVSSETMRRYKNNGKFPPFDFEFSRKTRGWKRSTLINAGFNL